MPARSERPPQYSVADRSGVAGAGDTDLPDLQRDQPVEKERTEPLAQGDG